MTIRNHHSLKVCRLKYFIVVFFCCSSWAIRISKLSIVDFFWWYVTVFLGFQTTECGDSGHLHTLWLSFHDLLFLGIGFDISLKSVVFAVILSCLFIFQASRCSEYTVAISTSLKYLNRGCISKQFIVLVDLYSCP